LLSTALGENDFPPGDFQVEITENVLLGRTTMTAIDPVCQMSVDPATAADHRVYEGHDVWFCNVACAQRFDENPSAYPLADD
ncbi:YHS domain-containing protein, partial [mine drainage metagenome]